MLASFFVPGGAANSGTSCERSESRDLEVHAGCRIGTCCGARCGIQSVHKPDSDGASNPLGIDRTDANAHDDIGLLNVLTLPLGRPVVVHLSSRM